MDDECSIDIWLDELRSEVCRFSQFAPEHFLTLLLL